MVPRYTGGPGRAPGEAPHAPGAPALPKGYTARRDADGTLVVRPGYMAAYRKAGLALIASGLVGVLGFSRQDLLWTAVTAGILVIPLVYLLTMGMEWRVRCGSFEVVRRHFGLPARERFTSGAFAVLPDQATGDGPSGWHLLGIVSGAALYAIGQNFKDFVQAMDPSADLSVDAETIPSFAMIFFGVALLLAAATFGSTRKNYAGMAVGIALAAVGAVLYARTFAMDPLEMIELPVSQQILPLFVFFTGFGVAMAYWGTYTPKPDALARPRYSLELSHADHAHTLIPGGMVSDPRELAEIGQWLAAQTGWPLRGVSSTG